MNNLIIKTPGDLAKITDDFRVDLISHKLILDYPVNEPELHIFCKDLQFNYEAVLGSISVTGFIEAENSIISNSDIRAHNVKAKGFIKSDAAIWVGSIKSESYIECGGDIKAYIDVIQSSDSIKAKGDINGWILSAVNQIDAGGSILSRSFIIDAKSIKSSFPPFSIEEYFLRMKPFRKYQDIFDSDNCHGFNNLQWKKLRDLTLDQAEEICGWEGWHPHIMVQLEMLYDLKERHFLESGL